MLLFKYHKLNLFKYFFKNRNIYIKYSIKLLISIVQKTTKIESIIVFHNIKYQLHEREN